MRKFVLTLFMASALIAGAQGFISPKARLLKQRYERYVTNAGTRGQALRGDVRGGFFVTCEKDADVRRVADDLKAKGASIRIVRGQQILLDIPLAKLDDLATVGQEHAATPESASIDEHLTALIHDLSDEKKTALIILLSKF